MFFPIILALLVIMTPIAIYGQQIVEECTGASGWSKFKGSCYKVFSAGEIEFDQAVDLCKSFGASVASIHSPEENDFVAQLCYDDFKLCMGKLLSANDNSNPIHLHCPKKSLGWFYGYLIGLNRNSDGKGGYISKWEDNSPVDFGNVPEQMNGTTTKLPWAPGQPSGTNEYKPESVIENCTSMVSACGEWNDLPCKPQFYKNVTNYYGVAGVVCKKQA